MEVDLKLRSPATRSEVFFSLCTGTKSSLISLVYTPKPPTVFCMTSGKRNNSEKFWSQLNKNWLRKSQFQFLQSCYEHRHSSTATVHSLKQPKKHTPGFLLLLLFFVKRKNNKVIYLHSIPAKITQKIMCMILSMNYNHTKFEVKNWTKNWQRYATMSFNSDAAGHYSTGMDRQSFITQSFKVIKYLKIFQHHYEGLVNGQPNAAHFSDLHFHPCQSNNMHSAEMQLWTNVDLDLKILPCPWFDHKLNKRREKKKRHKKNQPFWESRLRLATLCGLAECCSALWAEEACAVLSPLSPDNLLRMACSCLPAALADTMPPSTPIHEDGNQGKILWHVNS